MRWDCPVRGAAPAGWGVFEEEGLHAVHRREAEPWEVEEALAGETVRRLVLLGRDPGGTAWASAADPASRPVAVGLVEAAEPFDEILAWSDGFRYWAVRPADGTRPDRADRLRRALGGGEDPPPGLRPGDRALYRLALLLASGRTGGGESPAPWHRGAERRGRPDDPEPRLRRALALGGADLLSWRRVPGGYQVEWRRGPHWGRTVVGEALEVLNAGFCLSGTDRRHDLTSLASLVAERPTHEEGGW